MSETEQEQEETQESKKIQEEEPAEYTQEMEEIEKDAKEVEKAQDKFIYSAEKRIARLANILKENVSPDGTSMSDEEIRNKIIHDCKNFWTKETILKNLPDWLKREIEQPEQEETQEEPLTQEGKEEDPVKALKEKITELSRTNASLKKSYDKGEEKLTKMNAELDKYKEQAKELKENSKLLDQVLDIYDKKMNALTFNVTGASILKMEEFANKAHSRQDDVNIVIKFGTKGHVIDSIS